jgi:hypothetical protein
MTRKCQVRFGGGPTEKARQRDLAGGLPDLTANLATTVASQGKRLAIAVPGGRADSDLTAEARQHQNQPSSFGLAYCMNSMSAPSMSTKAMVANPLPISNGSATMLWPSMARRTSVTR